MALEKIKEIRNIEMSIAIKNNSLEKHNIKWNMLDFMQMSCYMIDLYVIISCSDKMSLFANVLFPSIDNGILNNLGPIHYPIVHRLELVLLREMACDFLCIGLFPEPALVLFFI